MVQEKIWNREFIKLWLCNLFVFTTFYALITTVPLFVIDMLKGGKQESGLAMMVFLIAAVFTRLISGRLLDTVGRRKILFLSLILFMVSSFIYLIVDHIVFLVILRIIHGASFGMATTATGTVAADLLPLKRKGEGIGYYALSYNTAMFLGPLLSLSILAATNFTIMFTVLSVLSVLSVLFALTIKVPTIVQPKEKRTKEKLHWTSFIEPNAIPMALTGLFLAFAFSGFLTYIPLYAQEIGMAQAAVYFYIVYALAMIASRPFVGRLADTYNENLIVYSTIFLYAIGLIVLSLSNHLLIFLLSAAIIGVGFGSISPILQAMSVKSTTSDRTGLATGTFLSFFDTGVGLGSFFLALIAEATNFRIMFGSSTLLVLIAMFFYYLCQQRFKMNQDLYNEQKNTL